MKVICPKCGEVGYLISVKVRRYRYFAVNHRYKLCYLGKNPILQLPFHRLKAFKFFGSDTPFLKLILSLVPPHYTYVEVFGGSVVVLLSKPPSKVEVYNDKDLDLYNLFLCYRDHINEMIKEAKYILYHRRFFMDFKEELKKPFKPPNPRRAIVFLASLIMSINGEIGGGFSSSVKVNNSRHLKYLMEEHLTRIHKRLRRVMIECLDFEELIKRYDSEDTWFYLDPPHIGNENRYGGEFTFKDHERLFKVLSRAKGKWLLRYTYHPWVHETYKDYNYIIVEYTKSSTVIKNGEGTKPKGKTIFIANYDLPSTFKNKLYQKPTPKNTPVI